MVPRRIPIILFSIAALGVAACSSSAKPATKATTTSSSTPAVVTIAPTQTTGSAAGLVTIATVANTISSGTTTSVAGGSSTATTTLGRVVASPTDNVKLGDSGPGVDQIQTALKAAGYKVTVDSKFGAATDKAVKAFQKKAGLLQDGVVGPKTWTKLKAAAGSGGTSVTTTTVKKSTSATTTTVKK